VFLTLAMVRLISQPQEPWTILIPAFFLQMAIGGAAGFAAGRLAVILLNRLKLEAEGLYPALTLAMVLLTYGATTLASGNGFLAVYVAGIFVGNADFIHKRSLLRFHDGLAWLMQIAMFLVLGMLVFPSRLVAVAGAGLLLSLFLMLLARPLAVFVALAPTRANLRQKLLTSWVGLRGAVPIILATFPRLAGVPQSDLYFHLVFFIVLTSVLLQGTTIRMVARRLKLEAPWSPRRQYPLEFVPTAKSRSEMFEIQVPAGSPSAGKQLVDLHLPKSALFVLLSRGNDFLAPRGATRLQAGDSILVLAERRDVPAIQAILGARVTRGEGEEEA
jgi:cell volume regulation protein A